MYKIVEYETCSLVAPLILCGSRRGAISTFPRGVGTGDITPWVNYMPVKGPRLDVGPDSIASLLYMVIDVVLKRGMPEIDPDGFSGVPQTDGRKYLHVAGDVVEHHACTECMKKIAQNSDEESLCTNECAILRKKGTVLTKVDASTNDISA